MATDLEWKWVVYCPFISGLEPPTLKLHKKFIHSDKILISTNLALVLKDRSTALYIFQNNTPIYVKILKSDANSTLYLMWRSLGLEVYFADAFRQE